MSYQRHLLRDFFAATAMRRSLVAVFAFGLLAILVSFTLRRAILSLDWPQVDASELMFASLATILRLTIAYAVSLTLAVAAALVVTSRHWAEKWLMPVFDILQSVPVLAFFPLAVILFARGGFYEGAAQLVLLTAMLWPILFSLVGAIRAIPRDVHDAAVIYGVSGTRYWRHVILPASFPAIVTGSILALGAGWNVVIIAEFINYGGERIALFGLGSLLDQATQSNPPDTMLFLFALVIMVIVIIVVNRLVWHRLLVKAEQYKFE